jgi:hypothetical protein
MSSGKSLSSAFRSEVTAGVVSDVTRLRRARTAAANIGLCVQVRLKFRKMNVRIVVNPGNPANVISVPKIAEG